MDITTEPMSIQYISLFHIDTFDIRLLLLVSIYRLLVTYTLLNTEVSCCHYLKRTNRQNRYDKRNLLPRRRRRPKEKEKRINR